MSGFTGWLMSLIATAFLVALCEALMMEERVRRVGRMAGGLLIILALFSPLLDLRAGDWELAAEDYFSEIGEKKEAYTAQQTAALSDGITEACSAYIESVADELGLAVCARVELRETEEGVPVPSAVKLDIPYNAALSARITEDLAIAPQAQSWRTKEKG